MATISALVAAAAVTLVTAALPPLIAVLAVTLSLDTATNPLQSKTSTIA